MESKPREGAFQVAARHVEKPVKARIVAQQAVCGELDDVSSGTRLLAVAGALLAMASSRHLK